MMYILCKYPSVWSVRTECFIFAYIQTGTTSLVHPPITLFHTHINLFDFYVLLVYFNWIWSACVFVHAPQCTTCLSSDLCPVTNGRSANYNGDKLQWKPDGA